MSKKSKRFPFKWLPGASVSKISQDQASCPLEAKASLTIPEYSQPTKILKFLFYIYQINQKKDRVYTSTDTEH